MGVCKSKFTEVVRLDGEVLQLFAEANAGDAEQPSCFSHVTACAIEDLCKESTFKLFNRSRVKVCRRIRNHFVNEQRPNPWCGPVRLVFIFACGLARGLRRVRGFFVGRAGGERRSLTRL